MQYQLTAFCHVPLKFKCFHLWHFCLHKFVGGYYCWQISRRVEQIERQEQ